MNEWFSISQVLSDPSFPEGFLHLRRHERRPPERCPELCPYLCVCTGDLDAATQPVPSGRGGSVVEV